VADKERPAEGSDGAGDKAAGRREGNPLEREISFVRQRGAVLRPGRSEYASRKLGRTQQPPEDAGEDSQPPTFRQQRMAEYRERLLEHQDDARDDSKNDG
jgi:hypothetical protein